MGQNENFVCAMCGEEDMPGFVGSKLVLEAGYGSAYDTERVKVPLCGECCDKLFDEFLQSPGAVVEDCQVGHTKGALSLDDETKRLLNEGKAIILDGGYLITTPKTIHKMIDALIS